MKGRSNTKKRGNMTSMMPITILNGKENKMMVGIRNNSSICKIDKLLIKILICDLYYRNDKNIIFI